MAEALLVLRIIKTIVGLIGLIGNTLVATVIYRVKFMHTLTNAFICNQAVVDFLGSLFLILSSNIAVPDPLPDTLGYHVVCHLWLSNLFLWAFFTSSTMNLLSLTCERYVAIVYPFKYATLYTTKSVTCIMVVIWLSGLILDGAYTAAVNTYANGQCFYSSAVGSRTLGIVFILVKFFIPAIFMLAVYSHMTVELKRSANRIGAIAPTVSATVNSGPGTSAGGARPLNAEESLLRARRNIFKTLLIVFLTFLVCWTPNQVIFFMFNFGWSLDFSGAIYIISVSLVAINSCVNPFIYAFKYKQFRRGFLSLIGQTDEDPLRPSEAATRQWNFRNSEATP
ncbi:pyroglutamylated RFamide peptide receptor-like [Acanthaster planci]|uniref:Pyroglutamylated RFamide peptide receptor-like n=1 Tax=Acanthaster planci TaxID=133434 RepID=A0A8B7Y6B1_ACAPL|nr:pyroglutamylated RFamide peptide receptor-like [Acanthaster planci]